ncbi:hypothetical protein MKX03_014629, partial [Papaver bracteatum]
VSDKLKMLHHELVKGNHKPIDELRMSKCWIGQAMIDKMRKDEKKHLHKSGIGGPRRKIAKPKKTSKQHHHLGRIQQQISTLHISNS